MQGIVSSKSQYGFKVEGNDNWFNYGKFYEGTQDFATGDTIEFEAKGKFLKTLTVVANGDGQAVQKGAEKSSSNRNGKEYPAESARRAGLDAAIELVGKFGKFNDVDEALIVVKELAPVLAAYVSAGTFNAEVAEVLEPK